MRQEQSKAIYPFKLYMALRNSTAVFLNPANSINKIKFLSEIVPYILGMQVKQGYSVIRFFLGYSHE